MRFAFNENRAFAFEDDGVVLAAAPVFEPDDAGIIAIGAVNGLEDLREGLDSVVVMHWCAKT